MLDYGTFVPTAMKSSSDFTIQKLGRKLDVIPFEADYITAINLVTKNTHAFIDSESYLYNLQRLYGVSNTTYILKESVSYYS